MSVPRHCVDASRQGKHVEAGASLSRDAPPPLPQAGERPDGERVRRRLLKYGGLSRSTLSINYQNTRERWSGRERPALAAVAIPLCLHWGMGAVRCMTSSGGQTATSNVKTPCIQTPEATPPAAFRVQHHFLCGRFSVPCRWIRGCRRRRHGARIGSERLLLETPEFDQVVGFADACALKAIKKKNPTTCLLLIASPPTLNVENGSDLSP